MGPESLPVLLEEKRLLINRSGVIEYIADGTTLGEVGGLENLKKWLLERRKLFQMRDSVDSEIVPKGVLIMGIPGCGKSLSVKADRVFVRAAALPRGHDRDFLRAAWKTRRRIRGSMQDDGRYGAGGALVRRNRNGDYGREFGGEQGRIFAFFLTWMQEKTRGLFVAATANRIDLLPAEMIRKGRFDEVFFVDLPLEDEQVEIFKIHLSRRGVDPSRFDLSRLTQFTNRLGGRRDRAMRGVRIDEGAARGPRTDPARSDQRGREDRAALAHDERADQSDSKLGVRARRAGKSAADRGGSNAELLFLFGMLKKPQVPANGACPCATFILLCVLVGAGSLCSSR